MPFAETAAHHFYPRPPRGGRPGRSSYAGTASDFYPRPPRGGRLQLSDAKLNITNFYPRPPRGGRQFQDKVFIDGLYISTHALREEGD